MLTTRKRGGCRKCAGAFFSVVPASPLCGSGANDVLPPLSSSAPPAGNTAVIALAVSSFLRRWRANLVPARGYNLPLRFDFCGQSHETRLVCYRHGYGSGQDLCQLRAAFAVMRLKMSACPRHSWLNTYPGQVAEMSYSKSALLQLRLRMIVVAVFLYPSICMEAIRSAGVSTMFPKKLELPTM